MDRRFRGTGPTARRFDADLSVGAYLCIVVVESHNLAWHHENDPVWIVAGTTGAPSCIEKFLSLENFASIQISIILLSSAMMTSSLGRFIPWATVDVAAKTAMPSVR